MPILKFTTEAEWKAAREPDVTSTDVAAMFGLHPYKSRLRLWLEKKGEIESEIDEDNPFIKWGRRLQIPVAMGICEDEGWSGYDMTLYYLRHPEMAFGASLDVRAVSVDRGTGNLEVKIAESFSEDAGWFQDKAPIQYEFQMQAQAHLAAKNGQPFDFNCLGAFGRRQSTRLYFRQYDAELGALMDEEVEKFQRSLRDNVQPDPDYTVDGPLIEKLLPAVREGEVKNLTTIPRAAELAEIYARNKAWAKESRRQLDGFNKAMDAAKSELRILAGDAETMIIGNHRIGMKKQVVEERWNPGYETRRFDFSTRKGR